MRTETLRTATPDGDAEALLFLPDHPAPAPLVVFLMDAFGLRPALTDMAARRAFVRHAWARFTANGIKADANAR